MGRKRMSMANSRPAEDVVNVSGEKKKKKKRRVSDPGMAISTTTGDASGKKSPKESEVVLRCAPEGVVNPIVVSFASMTLPPDVHEMGFTMHTGNTDGNKVQHVVMGEGARMDYLGLNFGPGDEANDLCSYLVGVEDKETGEMTLYEAGHAYALRQSVAGREELIEEHANEGMEWKERRDALVNQFGSKKKKAAIRSRDANVIGAESVVGGGALSRVLKEVLKNDEEGLQALGSCHVVLCDVASEGLPFHACASITCVKTWESVEVLRGTGTSWHAGNNDNPTVKDGAAGAVEEARRRFLPPMKPDASTPEEVYSAKDIAVEQALQSMGRQIDALAQELEGGLQQWVKEFAEQPRESCPLFVSSRITLLPDVSQPAQRHRMLQLLFLRHMIVFHHSKNILKGRPSQLAYHLDIPEIVLRHLLEKFAVAEPNASGGAPSYARTTTLKNQLLVHALCLALVLDGCRLEFNHLAHDIKRSEGETRALMRELGCAASNTMAQLKIPLVFPRSRKGRAK